MIEEFARIRRLPPYVFNIVNDLKTKAGARGDMRVRVSADARVYKDMGSLEFSKKSLREAKAMLRNDGAAS